MTLLIVSNRLPLTVLSEGGKLVVKQSTGGLVSGMRSVVRDDASLWIGWPGDQSGLDPIQCAEVGRRLAEHHAVAVSLSPAQMRGFYDDISNGVLWPIFHDRVDRVPLVIDGWDTYEAVNQVYADAVVARWRPGDLIWIHDYHLLRAPALIRAQLPEARIGFFLHIPFPNPEIYFTLSVRRWLMEGMLGADVIGFHTRRYRGHYTGALRRLFGIEMQPATGVIEYEGRRVKLSICPMGVDAADFAQRAASREVSAKMLELRGSGNRLLVGIDRLDYSKGIERRMLAFERLLVKHPEWRGRIRLIQVAVPSRNGVGAYQRLRSDVEGLVGRINGEYGSATWTPIHYLYRAVSPTTLLALYRAADVMLVTPLRDGMNLVAKEFVACRGDEDGMLVLSEFAGAADELIDACIVNPYDVDHVANTIHDALATSGIERRTRMRMLREQVFAHDVHRWASDFLKTLGGDANS